MAKLKILLVDRDDLRRDTRILMLEKAGYEVDLRSDHNVAELRDHEGTFDLILLALHGAKLQEAAAYSERLRKARPGLPILLLTDTGVFVPRGTLSKRIETGHPFALMEEIAEMLAGSKHIRELESDALELPD